MEALAKHAFNATADDELSFNKEDLLKVISKEDDQNWYKAECNGREGFVPNNYIAMKPHHWFMGKCKRCDAEEKLLEKRHDTNTFIQPDGAFLVRHSESAPGDFSMSVKWYKGKVTRTQAEELLLRKNGSRWEQPDGAFLVRGCESQPGEFSISVKFRDGVQHFKILRDGCGKYFLWVVKFDSINALVEHHRSASVSRVENIFLKDMVPTGHCRQAVALYDFKVEDASEIDMCKGDCITGIEAVDENWWKGVNMRTNKAGLFPKSYVAERHDN